MEQKLVSVFSVMMLFREPVDMPDRKTIMGAVKQYTSAVRWMAGDNEKAIFNAWGCRLDDGQPAMMIVNSCKDFQKDDYESLQVNMMMEFGEEERDQILGECRYQVVAEEMVQEAFPAQQQANLAGNFLDALADLYPTCQVFYNLYTRKLVRSAELRTHQVKGLQRYLNFCVNFRSFVNGEKRVVDTLGMELLHLPDVQFFFHNLPKDYVMECALKAAQVMLEQGKELPEGAALPSVREDGMVDRNLQWKCAYGESLFAPHRRVLNVSMGEYALDPKKDFR